MGVSTVIVLGGKMSPSVSSTKSTPTPDYADQPSPADDQQTTPNQETETINQGQPAVDQQISPPSSATQSAKQATSALPGTQGVEQTVGSPGRARPVILRGGPFDMQKVMASPERPTAMKSPGRNDGLRSQDQPNALKSPVKYVFITSPDRPTGLLSPTIASDKSAFTLVNSKSNTLEPRQQQTDSLNTSQATVSTNLQGTEQQNFNVVEGFSAPTIEPSNIAGSAAQESALDLTKGPLEVEIIPESQLVQSSQESESDTVVHEMEGIVSPSSSKDGAFAMPIQLAQIDSDLDSAISSDSNTANVTRDDVSDSSNSNKMAALQQMLEALSSGTGLEKGQGDRMRTLAAEMLACMKNPQTEDTKVEQGEEKKVHKEECEEVMNDEDRIVKKDEDIQATDNKIVELVKDRKIAKTDPREERLVSLSSLTQSS